MMNQFSRTELLLGKEGVEKLKNAHVAVFGLGGVGSYTVEALCRSGVGTFTLVDNDTVSLTNLNRQLIATQDTVGQYKTEVSKERILSINPDAKVHLKTEFYLPETDFDFSGIDYIVDAIDTVTAKLHLIETAHKLNIPIISSMGTGNKLDPTKLEVTDISKTSVCPLARVMRQELRKRGIGHLKVVYSKEEPLIPQYDEATEKNEDKGTTGRKAPGSVAFVPSVAGLIIAGEVMKDIVK
ncbi:MAG: tRNA threonylcarbamoyladenosine dehydratase [Clostridia bacterium]|nr:tRNA threonylcarbamoyladenosine dehydratase [Clostridia bacterium]